jgi:hypothetical protein
MTGRLQEELARIADAAPVAEVPADTWARARRARRRDRGLALAASAAVVALVAGLVSWLPTLPDAAVVGSSAPGLPDHLYAVPERMSARGGEDDVWLRDEVTSDVAVGRAAAAWLTPDGLPVVVGATDGRYHLLDLPGFSGNNWVTSIGLHPATIALSPDGRRLAYSWATFGPDAANEPIPSGVRVLDLESGTIREIPLPGAEGTAVEALGWSADSRWLAWGGARLGSWTTGSMGRSEPIAGRIAPGATTGEEYVPRRVHPFDAAVGVDVRGNVSLFGNGAVNTWDGRNQRVAPLDNVAVTTRQASVDAGGRVALPSRDGHTLFVLDSLGAAVRQSDIGRLDDGASEVHALGWVGDELLLATNGAYSAELRLFSVDDERSRVVGTVAGGVAPTLTVAIDLVTADRPTVERPEPDWPWSDERRAVMIGLGVVGVLGLLYGARRIERRRPLR